MAKPPDDKLLKSIVGKDHYAQQLTKLGGELVAKAKLPNVITVAQFQPFIELYRVDKTRRDNDKAYRDRLQALYDNFIHGLGINRYQPIIVIESLENPVDVYYLDRQWTAIRSDLVDGDSARNTVPNNLPKTAPVTRDELIEGATLRDVVSANSTLEQKAYFKKVQETSAYLRKRFTERNLSPDLRTEQLATKPTDRPSDNSPSSTPSPTPSPTQYLVDDDD